MHDLFFRLFGFGRFLRSEQRGCVAVMAADALRYSFPGQAKQSKLGPLGGGLPVDHLSRRQSIYTAHSLPTCTLAHFHGALYQEPSAYSSQRRGCPGKRPAARPTLVLLAFLALNQHRSPPDRPISPR